MDASQLPKGQSLERTDGRQLNQPGIYVHKDTGAKYITAEGEEGVIQADALQSPVWKDAWERKGDVPSRVELLKMNKEQQVKEATAEALDKGKEAAELKQATKKSIQEAKEAQKAELVV